jgi:chaperonin GroES
MKNKFAKPNGDRVLLKVEEEKTKTASGIFIPDSAKSEDVKTAVVKSIGNGIYTNSGVLIPMQSQVGDEVLIPAYHQGTPIKLDGEEFVLMREGEILMFIK